MNHATSGKVRVKVVEHTARGKYVLRWRDQETGAQRQETTDATTRKQAERKAGELEARLRTERYDADGRVSWSYARRRFEEDKFPQLKQNSIATYKASLNVIERAIRPRCLADVTPLRLSKLTNQMREDGLKDATINRHLTGLKVFLRWCCDVELIARLPKIKKLKIAASDRMHGRPITDDEFAKMLNAVEAVVGREAATEWRYYLCGMWLSGLRRDESLKLSWDVHGELLIDLSGKRPVLRIWTEHDKGGKARMTPITPDFDAFLRETPQAERTGQVFKLLNHSRTGPADPTWVSRTATLIGKQAGVIVNQANGSYASLHDLRRTFALRWSEIVEPFHLQELMRHASITTTQDYYLGRDAQRTADAIFDRYERLNGDANGDQAN